MSDGANIQTTQLVTPSYPPTKLQIKPLDANQVDLRKQMANAVQTIAMLRKESEQLKAQLAEAQKTA